MYLHLAAGIKKGGDCAAVKKAMLPNIKGILQSNSAGGAPFAQGQEGIFQDITSAYVSHIAQADYGYSGMTRVEFNAAFGSDIYNDNNVLQPPAVTCIPQLKF